MDDENELKWLISNEDLDTITDGYMYDWVLEKFNENGLTSEDDSFWKIHFCRFQYTYPDCPHCGTISKHYVLNRELWGCNNPKCRQKFSITSCTYIDNTKTEFYKWFRFAWLVGQINLTNSAAIARDLNVTQKTAWGMLDTLRTARKETSETKFVNGSEVLAFTNYWDILELLLKKRVKKIISKEDCKVINPEK